MKKPSCHIADPCRQPTFSVITVCRNAQDTLEATLQSVLSQTYPHVEYILVDGASTDATADIIRRYRPRLARVLSEPDRGLYDAMNKGLRLATGDYLCFLNAGDCLHDADTLEHVVRSLPAGGCLPDVIYGDTALVDAHRRFLRLRRLRPPRKLTWRSFRQGMLVCHQAFFARRTLAQPYDTSYRYSADFDWCIRLMKQADVLHNTHLVLIDYLSEGLSTRHRTASLRERFRIMTRHYGWITTLAMHAWFVCRAVIKR